MEMIKQWQTEDGYPDDLIQLALKEAVLNQAFSLKYMDRILLSWERKGIKTKNQAIKKISEYNMRNDQEEISVDSIPKVTMHNWLNPEGN